MLPTKVHEKFWRRVRAFGGIAGIFDLLVFTRWRKPTVGNYPYISISARSIIYANFLDRVASALRNRDLGIAIIANN
jgi:hypothetical protein